MVSTGRDVHLMSATNTSSDVNTMHMQAEAHALTIEDTLLHDIESFFKIYYSMFLVILGTVFNVLSIAVLQRLAFRRTTASVFLQYLAAIDLVVLYIGLSRQVIQGVSGYDLRLTSEHLCRFHAWSTSCAPDASVWTLVAVTLERVVSIAWPHKVKTVCTRKIARVAITCICVSAMCFNLPLLIFYGDRKVVDKTTNMTIIHSCAPMNAEDETFIADIWYWLDIAKFILLPGAILISSSVVIVFLVIRSRQRVAMGRFKHSQNGGVNSRANNLGGEPTVSSLSQINIDSHRKLRVENGKKYTKTKQRTTISRKEISVTITLVVINVVFLVCNTPVIVYLIGNALWFDCGSCPGQRLLFTMALLAMYTSNAINFLLYCATGSKFRGELRIMFMLLFKVKTI
ncbi:hypothetical protein BsWGS_19358 [Bradybaena similaris]